MRTDFRPERAAALQSGGLPSKGCRLCQRGEWLCIFMTFRCDAACPFCPMPQTKRDGPASEMGDRPDAILRHLGTKPAAGIGFSGGEPFLVFDRMLDWLRYFKKRLPESYFWAYTNGKRTQDSELQRLARAGLDEIRFNIAATGYGDESILEKVKTAVRLIPRVAVEVPSIPDDYGRLTGVLPDLDARGVRYLNLHEYVLMPGDPRRKNAAISWKAQNLTDNTAYDAGSPHNTEKIIQFCSDRRLRLRINDCGHLKKENQFLQRRLRMGRRFREKHERLTPGGLLETLLLLPEKLSGIEIRDRLRYEDASIRNCLAFPSASGLPAGFRGTVVRLFFLPPMSLDGRRELLQIQGVGAVPSTGLAV
jgi:uncharacterized protein